MSIDRFVQPIEDHLGAALDEISAGRKETHWMWFIFPQLRSLGRSDTARHFGIADLDEALRLLAHPALGASYEKAVMTTHESIVGRSRQISYVFPSPDDLKLVSSLTLFEHAAQLQQRVRLFDACSGILAAAERQGLERCRLTLAEIGHLEP